MVLIWQEVIFQVFGGLGLFLMGMKIMSDALQKLAGKQLRRILERLTTNRFSGVGVGIFITAALQSSSLTTVMLVSLVDAGLMTLRQSIGVVLGANIGTTLTAWLVSFDVIAYGLPIIGVGALIRFFSGNKKGRYLGEIIFGIGALFLGMELMKMGVLPLRESEFFRNFFVSISGTTYSSILLGVFVGTMTTVVVQSSAATIGMAIALASQGLIGFVGAVALVLGDNIGTTITAIIASIGTNTNAKRVAVAHSLFNILGVIWITAIFFYFVGAVDWVVPGNPDFTITTAEEAAQYGSPIGTKPLIGPHIAMAHTMFNVTNVIVFLPLVGLLVFLSQKIVPDPKGGIKPKGPFIVQPKFLDFTMVDSPSVSIIQSQNELNEMSKLVDDDIARIREAMEDYSKADLNYRIAKKNEHILTNYRDSMNKFLLAVSGKELSESDAQEVLNHMAIAHSLDRMGYFSRKMCRVYLRMHDDKIQMSPEARAKIKEIFDASTEFYNDSMKMLRKGNGISTKSFTKNIPKRSDKVKNMIKAAKLSHFERAKKGICPVGAGLYYIDLLNIFSNMQYQTRNLAEAVVGKELTEEENEDEEGIYVVGRVYKKVKREAKKTRKLLEKPLKPKSKKTPTKYNK